MLKRIPGGWRYVGGNPENKIWICPECRREIAIKSNKDICRVSGHLSYHKRKRRWGEKDFVKAVEMWKRGYTPVETSEKIGISSGYLVTILRKRLGDEYLKRRYKRRKDKKKIER